MPYLLLLFILMPIVEIAVLIRVGGAIGLLPTLAIVILTAVIGTHMLRQQGRATLARARERLDSGAMPAGEIIEGMLLLVGGVLLLTPGFVTDAFGFACLVPVSRRWLAARLSARSIGVVVGGFGGTTRGEPGSTDGGFRGEVPDDRTGETVRTRTPRTGRGRDRSDDVIEGDYRRLDD